MKQKLLVASITLSLVAVATAALPWARHPAPHESSASGSLASARTRSARRAGDASEVKRKLQEAEPGTYIGEILLTRDSALARWHDRTEQPLNVIGSIQYKGNKHIFQAELKLQHWEKSRKVIRFCV